MASRTSSDGETVTTLPSHTSVTDGVESFAKYLHDKNAGTILYRKPRHWGKTICCYLSLYTFLGLFFTALMAILYQTLDWNYPKLQGPDSIFRGNPGLSFRPNPNYQTTLIRYVKGDGPTTRKYIDHIESFIRFYENENQIGDNFADCKAIGTRRDMREKVCRFDISTLGRNCVKQQNYGYDDGMPCVILKLNKIFNWEPEAYDNSTIPDQIRDRYKEYAVTVKCEGETPADRENLGPVDYFPPEGFHFKYFPYLNQQGYRSPLVMVQFADPTPGILLMIECKAYARNIKHNRLHKIGTTHFELLVD